MFFLLLFLALFCGGLCVVAALWVAVFYAIYILDGGKLPFWAWFRTMDW